MKKLIAIVMVVLPMFIWGQNDISKLIKLDNKKGNYLLGATIYYNENLAPIDTVYVLAACDEYDYYAPSFPAISGYYSEVVQLLNKLTNGCINPDMEGLSLSNDENEYTISKGKVNIRYFDGRSKNFSRKELLKFKEKITRFVNGK